MRIVHHTTAIILGVASGFAIAMAWSAYQTPGMALLTAVALQFCG